MNWQALLLEPAIMTAIVNGRSALLASNASSKVDKITDILVIAACCLGLVAALAFFAGGFIWLERVYDVQTAILVIGGAATGLCVLLLIAAYAIARYKRYRIASYQKEITAKAEAIVAAVLAEIEKPVLAYPKSAVAVAALAGYIAAHKIEDGTETLMRTFERLRA